MRVLFLYAEITGYMLACLEALLDAAPDSKLTIYEGVSLPETNFVFPESCKYEVRSAIGKDFDTLWNDVELLNPDVVYVSGWAFPNYLKIARRLHKRGVRTILANDTPWYGTLRQRIGCLWSRLFLVPHFDRMWVPGDRHKEFARRLGFGKKTETGLLSADTAAFEAAAADKEPEKVLLSAGSFSPNKGMRRIAEAFLSLPEEQYAEWSLHLVGQTAYGETVPLSPRVHVSPYAQPCELPAYFAGAGAFILASRKESWGVVVHEAAAAGLPLLLSSATGAADAYLKVNTNGWTFDPESKSSLISGLKRMMDASPEQRRDMSRYSYQLSKQQSPAVWARIFTDMCIK